jgi:hypothetical protein
MAQKNNPNDRVTWNKIFMIMKLTITFSYVYSRSSHAYPIVLKKKWKKNTIRVQTTSTIVWLLMKKQTAAVMKYA